MRIRAWALLALAATLPAAGCSTKHAAGGPDFVRFRVPVEEGAALVYVFRYRSEPPDAPATVLAGAADVAELKQFEYTWFYAPPGRLALGARWPQLTKQQTATVNLDVEAGGTYYVELTGVKRTTASAEIIASNLEPLPLDRAEKKLEYCKYQKPRTATPGK
jgi:hypothetical protein